MAQLVAVYRQGVPVEELVAVFRANRTTVFGHFRRHGVPTRDRRALRQDEVVQGSQALRRGPFHRVGGRRARGGAEHGAAGIEG
ncbi:MAG: hypothetical protein ACRDVP_10610, partial [Acidimicrobiales bacterium]